MFVPQHHGGMMVIVGGGPASSPDGGGAAAGPKQSVIPFPKGFDPGDAQPGDAIDVTVHGKISEDGKGLIVLGMDGADTDESSEQEPEGGDSTSSDDDSNPGDRWGKVFGGGQ